MSSDSLSIRPFIAYKFNYKERKKNITHTNYTQLISFTCRLQTDDSSFYDNCTSCKCTVMEFQLAALWPNTTTKWISFAQFVRLPVNFKYTICHNRWNIQPWVENRSNFHSNSVAIIENSVRMQWKRNLVIEAAQRWRHLWN